MYIDYLCIVSKSSFKSNFLSFFISLIVCLILAEIVLRVITPDEVNKHQLFCEYDPVLGWRKKPNFEGRHVTPEYDILEKINSQSIRGPEYKMEKDSGEFRILVLGDSFAEGYTVEFEELFSEKMKAQLNNNCEEKYEVINGGTGGWSTDQEVLFFENIGRKYNSDYTVLLFCENDVWYNAQKKYWRGGKPQFIISDDSLKLTNVPVPTVSEESFFQKIKTWGLENVQLVKYIKRAKDNLKYSTGSQSVPVEWEVYRKKEMPEIIHAWELTEKLLVRLRQKTEASGSELLVFYISEKVEIYDREWGRFLETYSLDGENFSSEIPRTKLRYICKKNEIPFFDPTAQFKSSAAADTSRNLYFEFDWHWNKYGHELVGQLLAERVGCRGE